MYTFGSAVMASLLSLRLCGFGCVVVSADLRFWLRCYLCGSAVFGCVVVSAALWFLATLLSVVSADLRFWLLSHIYFHVYVISVFMSTSHPFSRLRHIHFHVYVIFISTCVRVVRVEERVCPYI